MPRSITSEYRSALTTHLLERDNYTCEVCGKTLLYHGEYIGDAVEIDHRVQVTDGGEHRLENYRMVHRSCNRRGRPRNTPLKPAFMPTPRLCEGCGAVFIPALSLSKWCSTKCGNAARVRRHRERKRLTP